MNKLPTHTGVYVFRPIYLKKTFKINLKDNSTMNKTWAQIVY